MFRENNVGGGKRNGRIKCGRPLLGSLLHNHWDLHGRSAYSKNTIMAGQHTPKKGWSAKGLLAGQHKAFFCQASADLFIGPVTACCRVTIE